MEVEAVVEAGVGQICGRGRSGGRARLDAGLPGEWMRARVLGRGAPMKLEAVMGICSR
jgi:hypothetical protein